MAQQKRLTAIMATTFRVILALAAVVGAALISVDQASAQQPRFRMSGHPGPPQAPPQPVYFAQNTNERAPVRRQAAGVLEAYPCPNGQAAAWVESLSREFAQYADVRIVADPRTSRILVQAPPAMQSRIAQRMVALGQTASAPPIAVPNSPRANVVTSREVRLKNITAEKAEVQLAGLLADRFSTLASTGQRVRNFELAFSDGQRVHLAMDHTRNAALIRGSGRALETCEKLVRALDAKRSSSRLSTRVVSLRSADPTSVRMAVRAIHAGNVLRKNGNGALAMQTSQQQPAPGDAPASQQQRVDPEEQSLIGPVQIEVLEGLDGLVIRGHRRDVERVIAIINQIEALSAETVPAIEIRHLEHVDCQDLAELIIPLYQQVYYPRQGAVSITALVKPNALLLVGRTESVQTALELVGRLDQPVAPETQFQVFRLKYANAEMAQQTITDFFAERAALGTKVLVMADYRSNTLIVRASPRDMKEVAEVIKGLDTPDSEVVNEVRFFQLENSLAEELEDVLYRAINGDDFGRQGRTPSAARTPGAGGTGTSRQQRGGEQKSTMLTFVTVDGKGQRRLNSGILMDVRITADPNANMLIVSAPAESMELIEALIRQLDQLPAAEALVKVYTIFNSDAEGLAAMLETLFGEQTRGDRPAVRIGVAEGESSLVSLRFAVDMRTNSIIVSGSMGDLQVVEAILLRLDDNDVRNRKNKVYRLRNAPAPDVAAAITEFLTSRRDIEQIDPDRLSTLEQIEREVIVVPERVSNSLIISATPRFFDDIMELIKELDERPPMVMIQVLIAEISLNDTDEFGVELGLQDSVLFDRSLLGDLVTTTTTTQTAAGQVANTNVVGASNTPGFDFNNQPLGNSGSTTSFLDAAVVGAQSLSSFAVGRMNNELGYGGLVLSASSESVSILIRALKECRRLEVLSRPQIMTLDNQPAFIQVGERVPVITSSVVNEAGQVNQVDFEDVGLILGVTPRISPDGLVVMEIDAQNSEVGPEDEGIPVTVSATGEVVRSPRIKITLAQTTVAAMSGQTVVLGGLITKSEVDVHRKVPFLGDLPLLGNLFRYDLVSTKRKELLIIMTPHIIKNEDDAEMIKQIEASRMSWCLGDVIELHGDIGMRGRNDEWSDAEITVVYPDLDPGGRVPSGAEVAPRPGYTSPRPNVRPPRTRAKLPVSSELDFQTRSRSLARPPTGMVDPNAWRQSPNPMPYGPPDITARRIEPVAYRPGNPALSPAGPVMQSSYYSAGQGRVPPVNNRLQPLPPTAVPPAPYPWPPPP